MDDRNQKILRRAIEQNETEITRLLRRIPAEQAEAGTLYKQVRRKWVVVRAYRRLLNIAETNAPSIGRNNGADLIILSGIH